MAHLEVTAQLDEHSGDSDFEILVIASTTMVTKCIADARQAVSPGPGQQMLYTV